MRIRGKYLHCSTLLLFAVAMCGMFPSAARAETVLRIGGTGCGLGTMRLLAAAYQQAHPDVSVRVMPSLGSSGGIAALLQGGVDLAISSRDLKINEHNLGAQATAYARTPFAFIVNRGVGKRDLTTAELERIYGGSMENWPGGIRIRPILRPAGDTDTQVIKGLSRAMGEAVTIALARPGMNFAVTDQESSGRVVKTPGAVGGATLTEIETERLPVNIVSFNGVAPTLENLARGSYPLAKDLYLVTLTRSSSQVRQFADFVRSEQGRGILKATGNLPPGIGR